MSNPTKGGTDGASPPRRTPLRVEVGWAAGVGVLWLVVAIAGFWLFLERIRHL